MTYFDKKGAFNNVDISMSCSNAVRRAFELVRLKLTVLYTKNDDEAPSTLMTIILRKADEIFDYYYAE
jgi:hypothetical protein